MDEASLLHSGADSSFAAFQVPDLVVNGRFLTRGTMSGVDRVAMEAVRALSALKAEGLADFALSLAVPAEFNAAHMGHLADVSFDAVHRGRLRGNLWEQLELPFVAGHRMLLNLCSIAPVWRSKQLVIIHDAQVFLEPASYSRAFRSWYRFAQPRIARRACAIATDSCFSLSQLERLGVAPPGKARVISIGIDHLADIPPDLGTLDRHRLTPGGYLLAIGSLAPHKNLAMLLRAAAARPDGSPELIVAGGGNVRIFQDAGLAPPPGTRLIGRVTDGELKVLYANARLFAFPSLTEGFGLPPLEAMAAGCPVVATTGGAVPEICGDAVRVVDPYDQDGWTRAMIELSENTHARHELIARGRARAARFSWRESAISLLRLLHATTPSAGRTVLRVAR